MNILLGVYACEPNKGSEPEVGWQMANEIARIMPEATVYAVTKANNKEAIEREGYPENLEFFYYEPPQWLTFWKKGGRGIRTYYYLWMIGAALYMKRQRIDFDIVHHVTFVNDWLPSFFSLLKRKENRFIWGPIGSHDPIDGKFLDGKRRKRIEKIRIFLQHFFRHFDPAFHYCKAQADCIVGINENVRKKLGLDSKKCFIAEPAIAMKKSDVEVLDPKKTNDEIFTIISVGRLIYIKNFKMTISAFANFLKNNPAASNVKLEIIGDGEDRKDLESLAKNLGVFDKIVFLGKVSRQEVQNRFANADLFLFPTLENAGFVILEAMSHGLPVVAMNYGGPQQFIKSHIADQLVSSALSYDEIASHLAEKIEVFYNDTNLRNKVGEQNRQDVLNHFTWETKAEKMRDIYHKVVHAKA